MQLIPNESLNARSLARIFPPGAPPPPPPPPRSKFKLTPGIPPGFCKNRFIHIALEKFAIVISFRRIGKYFPANRAPVSGHRHFGPRLNVGEGGIKYSRRWVKRDNGGGGSWKKTKKKRKNEREKKRCRGGKLKTPSSAAGTRQEGAIPPCIIKYDKTRPIPPEHPTSLPNGTEFLPSHRPSSC